MWQQGMMPDVITYGSLTSACGNGLLCGQVLEVLRAMQQQGVVPDMTTYNALIRAC